MNKCAYSQWPTFAIRMMAVAVIGFPCMCGAQYRPDQPVVRLPPVPASRVDDTEERFRSAYEASGSPRIVLFWNVSFDDATQSDRRSVEEVTTRASRHLEGADTTSDSRRTRSSGERIVDHAKVDPGLDSADQAKIESAFRRAIEQAGVRLIGRNASIRLTKAGADRGGVDAKLVETDALRAHADLLLEVIGVSDAASLIGIGFTFKLTDIKTGRELISDFQSASAGAAPPEGRYVATSAGYEWRRETRPVVMSEVGESLARAVLRDIEQSIGRTK